jgi:hypothetical protein
MDTSEGARHVGADGPESCVGFAAGLPLGFIPPLTDPTANLDRLSFEVLIIARTMFKGEVLNST